MVNPPVRENRADGRMADLIPDPHILSHLIPLSDFRTHIAQLVPRVAHVPERLVLTKHGRPLVAVVSMRDLAMVEKFDGRSLDKLRNDFDNVTRRFAAAQEVGRRPETPPLADPAPPSMRWFD